MRFIDVGPALIDADRLVAIEYGPYRYATCPSNDYRLAIAVLEGNTRVQTDLTIEALKQLLVAVT